MQSIQSFWDSMRAFEVLGNNLQNIFFFVAELLVGFAFKRFISEQFSRLAYYFVKKVSNDIPVKDFVALLKPPVEFLILILVIYFAFDNLDYPRSWNISASKKLSFANVVTKGYELVISFGVIWLVFRIIDFFALVLRKRASESESKLQEQLVPFMRQLIKMVVGILFFFGVLAVVFKVNVGAVIAGLGIGGIAVALAGKETLENLIASFAIFVDKPFVAGDLVKVQNIVGNVESVGFRTTRIRTLDKSQITIPNKLLVDQPLENLTNRKLHRAKFVVGLTYNTDLKVIKETIEKIKQIIYENELCDKSFSVYLDNLGVYAVEIVVLYNVISVEYEDFWKVKEEINFKIIDIINESGADIEYPTSVVYLRSEPTENNIKK